MKSYMKPVAQHLTYPDRLLLVDAADRWFVWKGESAAHRPEEIAAATALWLLTKDWIVPIVESTAWIHVDDLPLALAIDPTRRSGSARDRAGVKRWPLLDKLRGRLVAMNPPSG